MPGAPIDDLAGVGNSLGFLVVDDRARVPLVFVGCGEGNAPHRILDADQILEFERNEIGRTHQQQIVGHDLGVDVPGRDSMAVIPIAHLFARPIIQCSEPIACLGSASCQQRFERRTHVIRGVGMENDAPAGLFQLQWINAESNPEHRRGQLVGMVKRARPGVVNQMTREVFNCARGECVLTGFDVDTVDDDKVIVPRRVGRVHPKRPISKGFRNSRIQPPSLRSDTEWQQFIADLARVTQFR